MSSAVFPKDSAKTRPPARGAASFSASVSATSRRRDTSEGLRDDGTGGEEVPGEGEGGVHVEGLACVHVHREEQPRLLPGVEVRAGRLPVDPAGPAVQVGAVRHRLEELYNVYPPGHRGQVVADPDVVGRPRGDALDDQPLPDDLRGEVA